MILIDVLKRKKVKSPPIWIMRQAGRYLPEFRKTKRESKGFMNMVYTPKIASHITLQPIKRFGFDAAIIFSDILIIPDSLGQKLSYEEGKGPKLKKMSIDQMIEGFSVDKKNRKLNLVYKAVRETKKRIKSKVGLIGFVGAPLTLSFFMLNKGKRKKYFQVLEFLKKEKNKTSKLFHVLEKAITEHAIGQLNAGAQIIQIFDTWANIAKGKDLQSFSIEPIKRISNLIKKRKPAAHIIVFPRNVGKDYTKYIYKHIDCISVGDDIKTKEIKEIQRKKVIQGNLPPKVLFNGGKKLETETKKILNKFSDNHFIFNLSHGIMPGTPIKNVQKLIKIIRNHKNEI